MFKKAIIALSLLFVMLLAVSSVSATDNITEDIVGVDNESSAHLKIDDGNEESSLTQNTIDSEEQEYNSSDVISISADNSIVSDDSNSKYTNLYLSDVDTYYYASYTDAFMYWCWNGYFEGKLVIYHGQSIVFSQKIDGDRMGAVEYNDYWMLVNNAGKPVPVGSYNAKLFSKQGKVLKTASIKIAKAPTDFFVDSITTKAGKKVTIKSYVEGDCGRAEYAKGKITLKINGKTYSASVKNGKFSISFKAPSKAKKYSCKITYSGDSNYKSSSTKFTLTVKKGSTTKNKKTTSFTVTVPVKLNQYTSKTVGKHTVKLHKYIIDYGSYQHIKIVLNLYKNNKKIKSSSSVYKTKVWFHLKNGAWKYWGVNNWGRLSFNELTYNQYMKVDKAKVTVWIKS